MAVQSCGQPRPAGGQEESPQTRGVRDLVRCRATGLAGRGESLAGQGEPTGLSCASGRCFPDVTGLPVQHLPVSEPLSGVEGSGPGAGPSVPTSPAADPGEGQAAKAAAGMAPRSLARVSQPRIKHVRRATQRAREVLWPPCLRGHQPKCAVRKVEASRCLPPSG